MNMFFAVSCAGIKNLRALNLSSGSIHLIKIVLRNDPAAILLRIRSWFKNATLQLVFLVRDSWIMRCCFKGYIKSRSFLLTALSQKFFIRPGSEFSTIETPSTSSWTPCHQVGLQLITELLKPLTPKQMPRKWEQVQLSLLAQKNSLEHNHAILNRS